MEGGAGVTTIKELRKAWEYEFKAWEMEMGSLPTKLIASLDRSEPYIMSRAMIFKLVNKKYAVAIEEGCSCYDAADADIEVHPTLEAAMKSFDKWRLGR